VRGRGDHQGGGHGDAALFGVDQGAVFGFVAGEGRVGVGGGGGQFLGEGVGAGHGQGGAVAEE